MLYCVDAYVLMLDLDAVTQSFSEFGMLGVAQVLL